MTAQDDATQSQEDTAQSREDIIRFVVAKAEQDDEFRALLISDPVAAAEDVLGAPLPPGININVVEEELGDVTIVLPAKDADLVGVDGGHHAYYNFWHDKSPGLGSIVGHGILHGAEDVVEHTHVSVDVNT